MDPSEGTREQASALADLQFHWDDKYVIAFASGTWSAQWRGSHDVLTALDEVDLRQVIREDYARRRMAEFARLRERSST